MLSRRPPRACDLLADVELELVRSCGSPIRVIIRTTRAAAAIDTLVAHGCRFLVFGRRVDGAFRTLSNSQLPESLRAICREVPAADFHADVSSTEIRRLRGQPVIVGFR